MTERSIWEGEMVGASADALFNSLISIELVFGCVVFFQKVLDGFLNIYRMRTSPAVPGVSADVGGSSETKKVFEIT
jgi:hypothetical protein